MIALREYQRTAINTLYTWFENHQTGNPLLVLPTGSGKSVIIAHFIKEVLELWPDQKIMILTHVKELIEQNANKLLTIWPQAPAGIYSAGLGKRQMFKPVIFAGIQSVYAKAMYLGHFDLVLIDEAHLIGHNSEGMYRKLLNDLTSINPALRIIGLTATPWRTGSGSIAHGEHALFHDVAYEVGIMDLLNLGHLVPLIPPSAGIATQVNTDSLHVKHGEFVASEVEALMDCTEITQSALNEVIVLGSNRKSWLIFCAGVNHAEHVAKALNHRGITTGCITGKTSARERESIIKDYKSGNLQALTNANVLTTGFDAPETDLLVFLRPTKSPGLFVQMCGRGMRPAADKKDCLVLDFAGNINRHGPIDKIKAWIPNPKHEGATLSPFKYCPSCRKQVLINVTVCECGYLFPIEEKSKHDEHATTDAILSNQVKANRIEIKHVQYRRHDKPGSPPSLRVDYYSNGMFLQRVASEWVCLEHEGYAKKRALKWWHDRYGNMEQKFPETIDEALNNSRFLKQPRFITVIPKGKYTEIIGHEW